MKNKKDAYLILAHKTNYVFYTLIELLDDEKNDIYIHMDKKEKNFNKEIVRNKIKKSNVFFVESHKCNWGGFSLVKAELKLLKESEKRKYRYYHLISGQDLPLKSQKEISNFFSKNYGKQFIDFQGEKFDFKKRTAYYYPFQEILGKKAFKTIYGKIICKTTLKVQKILGIQRNKNTIFQKGSQWFSITHDMVKYIVNKEQEIDKVFKNTYCSDEIVIQTLFINSEFKNDLYSNKYNDQKNTIKRYIDWNRGTPYVWKKEDFDELINSGALFARKFDESIDKDIIVQIKNYIKNS